MMRQQALSNFQQKLRSEAKIQLNHLCLQGQQPA